MTRRRSSTSSCWSRRTAPTTRCTATTRRGNGDSTLAQFGQKVTPNQHALAKQFGLYDNIYDVGTNSAEGHNWLMQGDNPEYTESSAGEYVRSYDTEDDVLGHQRSGFLWTAAESAGKTARNFGEFTQFETKPAGATWQKYYCAAKSVDGRQPERADGPVHPAGHRVADPVPEHDHQPRLPEVRHRHPRPLPLPDLEAGLREERSGEPQHVLALQRPHRWDAGPRGPGRRQRRRRGQDRRRDLAQQVLEGLRDLRGRRTTARTAPTTSTATVRRFRSSARGPRTAPSTAPTTPRSRWCAPSSRSSAPSR